MSTTAPAVTKAPGQAPPSAQDLEPKRNQLAFWLLLPASALLVVVLGYPIVNMVILSLQEAKLRNITRGTQSWNNFANYTKILGDPYFWEVVVRTLAFTVVCVVGDDDPGNARRPAAEQARHQDAPVRAGGPAPGVGHPGGHRDPDLAVPVRHPVRRRELGARRARLRSVRGLLVAGRAAESAGPGGDHRRVGGDPLRGPDPVRRPVSGPQRDLRGGLAGRCVRSGPSSGSSRCRSWPRSS